ncbi:MAG: hypothetical protein IPO81_30025 [Kouleothrix sp.]|nr:hypothetical protein [Kouleothrix sp.]
MFRRSLFTLTLTLAALLALAAPALAGGWAIVTLDTLPREARAGETLHLGFMVRQHGKTPINDVSPYLLATKQGTTQAVRADARQEGAVGHFVVDVSFPSDGVWEWEIAPEPFEGTKMAPLTVLPAAVAQQPAAPAPVAPPEPAAPVGILGLSVAALRWGGVALLLAALGLALATQRGVFRRRVA